MSANPPSPSPEPPKSGRNRTFLFIGIGAVVLILIAIAAAVWMYTNPAQAQTIRDIFITALACETLLVFGALIVLIWQIYRLTQVIQNEIKPVIRSANETVTSVRGTTVFVSNNLVNPLIRVVGRVAGARRAIEVMAGRDVEGYLND